MDLEVIKFQKSIDERLSQYLDIFGNQEKCLPASEIKIIWSSLVEVLVKQSEWHALWNLPRVTCEKFGIQFPTLILVMVEEVHSATLSALVSTLAVQTDIHIAKELEVPLVNLFPTVLQEFDVHVICDTAELLDNLRFFYHHIWYPWDKEEDADCQEDWIETYFKPRMDLQRQIEVGEMSQETAEHIWMLLQKGWEIKHRIELLEEHESSGSEEDTTVFYSDNVSTEFQSLYEELQKIKMEVVVFDNPYMRKFHLAKLRKSTIRIFPDSKEVFIIWLGGTCDDFIKTLNEARSIISPDHVKPSSFQNAMNEAVSGDTILLCPGAHKIDSERRFVKDIIIKGFPNSICSMESGNDNYAVINWHGTSLVLENVTIKDDHVQVVLMVRCGVLILKGCRIQGCAGSTATGIAVQNSRVEMEDCELFGLETAIMVYPGSALYMTNSKIDSCKVGIKTYDDSTVTVKGCTITCNEPGIGIDLMKTQNKVGYLEGGESMLHNTDDGGKEITSFKQPWINKCQSLEAGSSNGSCVLDSSTETIILE